MSERTTSGRTMSGRPRGRSAARTPAPAGHGLALALALAAFAAGRPAEAQLQPVTPPEQRGRIDAERSGVHDAANMRTLFWNFGMVGDYPADPLGVDLTVFHSAEAPRGSGMNYSDGVTPFVLARLVDPETGPFWIMETGFRERQGISPYTNRQMRFEPRPGFFQPSPLINAGRSPAMSHDPRTWPESWPDRDSTWSGDWNGYFGKRPAADQESFTVMDDQAFDAWPSFNPDTRDATRRGLGLRVEVRGFQWSNPQAGNVIFWHYDIVNESTTDYDDDVIFGLYMDSGVGGSAVSCDGVAESDDDNAFFDKSQGLNLVYTWDKSGHGRDLSGPCGTTGYLGYAYLETPGNALNAFDDDSDGVTDELRDGGPGNRVDGQASILSTLAATVDTAKFRAFYGSIESRPAYRAGLWFTGDEDLDWRADLHDVGADGVKETGDPGEGDGLPTAGEPNFDQTDLNESDQIGLTGFKMNRIRAGQGNPDQTQDGIVFYTDNANWPERLWNFFTNTNTAARFDSALAANYNIGFLFASGPFKLKAGKRERFSLALAYGADLFELRETVKTVQLIYNANYQFAVPPTPPTARAEAGDGFVRLTWDDVAERSFDPVTSTYDFEGYKIYRSTDPDFLDPKVLVSGTGNPLGVLNGKAIAQFDLVNGKRGYSNMTYEGVAYWLGTDNGITHTWTDTTVTNGQQYYYAVCAYDAGFDLERDGTTGEGGVLLNSDLLPSENSISVSRTLRGGLILPVNAVTARPNPRAPGYTGPSVTPAVHAAGRGDGTVGVNVVNVNDVPDDHVFHVTFTAPEDSIAAEAYTLTDSTSSKVWFTTGTDFQATGAGPVGAGLLPLVWSPGSVAVDSAGYTATAPGSNTRIRVRYQSSHSINERRPGYPETIRIEFADTVQDTGFASLSLPARPAKFKVFAETDSGDVRLDFRLRDPDFSNPVGGGTLSRADEYIQIATQESGPATANDVTWHVELDTTGQYLRGPIQPPRAGDVWRMTLIEPLGPADRFTFRTRGQRVDGAAARAAWNEKPYVVPNPYVGSASFEPARFAVSGRGERRLEFRGIPQNAVVRIYTVRGDLVQTLRHNGSTEGFVAWDLRSKDNLEVAPGLYIFHVEAGGLDPHVGKFAVVK